MAIAKVEIDRGWMLLTIANVMEKMHRVFAIGVMLNISILKVGFGFTKNSLNLVCICDVMEDSEMFAGEKCFASDHVQQLWH